MQKEKEYLHYQNGRDSTKAKEADEHAQGYKRGRLLGFICVCRPCATILIILLLLLC